jgi:C-terminal processing protease CtpA/Prc
MNQRRILFAVTGIVLVLSLQVFGCQLATPSPTSTLSPTETSTSTPTFTPVPTFTPTPTLVPTPISLLDTDEPFLITGVITYTSPFFENTLRDGFVLLEDQAGFASRDKEFQFPEIGQTLGPIEEVDEDNLTYSLLLPAVPQGTFVDVDNDGGEDQGVQIYAVAYWSNTWGDPFLEQRDGLGWSTAYTSAVIDPEREGEIVGGILIVWAPDDQQAFPTGFGDDEMLFTEDDPTTPIPAGYSIVDLDQTPFNIYKEAQPKIDLLEGEVAVNDYSDMDYEEAFEAMFEKVSREYPFTEEKDLDWDALHDEFSPRVATARDDEDFYIAIRDFTWAIPDGHVGVGGESDAVFDVLIQEEGGGFGLVLAELSDERVIVTEVLPDLPAAEAGIQVGAEIIEWDDKPVAQAIDEEVPYFGPYSTDHSRRIAQVDFLPRGEIGGTATVRYRNPGGGARTVSLESTPEFNSLINAMPYYTQDPLALPVEGEVLDESGLGYIKITTFSTDYKMMTDLWDHYMEEMIEFDVPGLIIDVRINFGGNGGLALDFAGYFFEDEIVRSNRLYYNDLSDKFEIEGVPERITPGPLFYDGPVVLLVGPDCVSACEGFAYSMTLEDRATIVGHYPSAGAYGEVGRGQYALPGDLSMQVPTGRSETPDGKVIIEGVGVVPDVFVPVTEESAMGLRDTVLEAAIEALLK